MAKVFCATWPLLACIPFSASYHRELRSGYSAQITSRTGKLRYLFSKQAALFIVGGVTASFPAFINLLLESMFIPCIGSLLAQDTSPFASLHLNAPFLYCLLLCGVLFIWGGAAASISLSVSRLLNSRVLIIIFPFLLMFFTTFVLEAFFPSSHFLLHPIHQPIPGAGGLHSSVLVFGEAFLLLALSSAVYYPLGIKHEGL